MGIDRTMRYLYDLPDDGYAGQQSSETTVRNVKIEARTADGPEHHEYRLSTCFCGRGVL